jgi:tRNA uridine 5-carboxymethylaminomethyl modification enzyme
MFTSRAEYRLLLRHDNADRRLTPIAQARGLIDESRWQQFSKKAAEIERVSALLATRRHEQVPLERILRRPETQWCEIVALSPDLESVPSDVAEQVTNDCKYSGYIARQAADVARHERLAERRIPDGFNFAGIGQLRAEAREKLTRIRPRSVAQAGRISGITPADLALLMVILDGRG